MKATAFTHDVPPQRVVFASGALARVGDEAARLKIDRALVVATPGSGARLGKKVGDLLGARAGDSVLLYTDGVSEAYDDHGLAYPLAERAAATAARARAGKGREQPGDRLPELLRDLKTKLK